MMEETHKNKQEENKQESSKRPQDRMLLSDVKLIRIMGKDIPGNKKLLSGLTRLKGISWAFGNSVCKKLNLNPDKRIEELTEADIKNITEFVKNPEVPTFLLNRRKDYNSGEDKHLSGNDLDLQKEFDIKRLKKIKAYKGIRHMLGQPVRGQRTKSHFRTNRKSKGSVGVTKTKTVKAPAPTAAKGGKK
jgi:small subunit ribosomal protein S13